MILSSGGYATECMYLHCLGDDVVLLQLRHGPGNNHMFQQDLRKD